MNWICIHCKRELGSKYNLQRHLKKKDACQNNENKIIDLSISLSNIIEENKNLKQELKELKSTLKQVMITIKGNNNNIDNSQTNNNIDNSQTNNNIDNSQTNNITNNINIYLDHRDAEIKNIPASETFENINNDDLVESFVNIFKLIYQNPNILKNQVIRKDVKRLLKVYEDGEWVLKDIDRSDIMNHIGKKISDLCYSNCFNKDFTRVKTEYKLKEYMLNKLAELELIGEYEPNEAFQDNLNDIKKIMLLIVN